MSDLDQELSKARILLVDDDPAAIQITRFALREYANVRFATNGVDALRLALEQPPDLILLDREMPGEDGFAVCKRLKSEDTLRHIPVIFLTANSELAFELRALELGAADFIAKPISPPRVQLRVRLHLELKKQMDLLRDVASIDGLTQLRNRRAFDEALAREWFRAARSRAPLSLLMIDVDYFKQFNDAYGHTGGDTCLRKVAQILDAGVRRPADCVFRYGGEEFSAVLPETPAQGAKQVAERLRLAIADAAIPHSKSAVAGHVTISVGVSTRWEEVSSPLPREGSGLLTPPSDPRILIEAADSALYLSKQNGRNRIEYAACSKRG